MSIFWGSHPHVIVFGSRTWTDAKTIMYRLVRLPFATVIREGEARGADELARRIWRETWGLRVQPFPADWDRHGMGAGHARNWDMARWLPKPVLAIGFRMPGKSNGTDGMARICEQCGIPVEKIGAWP